MGRRFHFVAASAAPVVYETETDTFIAAVIAGGDTLSTGEQNALDRFVKDIKGISNPSYATSNIYSKFQALWPIVGSTATSHKWNLINPVDSDAAYRLTFTGCTHSTGKIVFNGTSDYADTKFPQTTLSQNDCHVMLNKFDSGSPSGHLFGVFLNIGGRPATYRGCFLAFQTGIRLWGNMNNQTSASSLTFLETTGSSSPAVFIVSRDNSSTYTGYRNGTVGLTPSQTSMVGYSQNLVYGAQRNGTTGVVSSFSAYTWVGGSLGTSLTSTEITNYTVAVQAFDIALSR